MSNELISSEISYTTNVNNHSTVLMRNISPQSAAGISPNNAGAVGPTEFIISSAPFNLSCSRLNFQVQLPAPAAGVNFINANGLTAISRVVLYDSATNAVWCDISNYEKFASLLVPAGTDLKDFLTKSSYPQSTTLPVTSAPSQLLTVEECAKYYNTAVTFSNNITTGSGNTVIDVGLQNPASSFRQFYQGAATAISFLDFSIELSAFKMCALSVNKLLYSPSNLVLQIYWNGTNNFAFSGTANDTAAAPIAIVSGAGCSINNISLTLANEGNIAIISKLINQVMSSGVSIPVGYPTTVTQTITSTAPSYQLQLTRGYGSRILAIITSLFSTNAVGGVTAHTSNCHFRGALTNYNTFLNAVALRYPAGFNCLTCEDYYKGNRNFLEDTPVQQLGEYSAAHWMHIDSFCGDKSLPLLDQTVIDGLDVGNQSSTWQFIGVQSANTSYRYITVIIGQKVITLSSNGSMIQ